jgi:SAM-dependent methyltransferase
MVNHRALVLYASTVFVSAFALFQVQPIIAKQILPWFGGSAAVWSVCMVFFQAVLLAGYGYAHALTRWLNPRQQRWTHSTLLLLSLVTLPILANPSWKPMGAEAPMSHILGLLLATVGLPYFVLATTGPLLQSWSSRVGFSATVYRLFSLSNLASLGGLVTYPFLVEPHLSLPTQAYTWSGAYGLYVVLALASSRHFASHAQALPKGDVDESHHAQNEWKPQLRDRLIWLCPSALASALLLAITNHLTQDVASIPFLWIVPLAIYLLTFVLCFESDRWYRRAWVVPAAWICIALCAVDLLDGLPTEDLRIIVPLYSVSLFVLCLFLHGELARHRPHPRYLTGFYLMVSLGGTLGGTTVALLAPLLLPGYYELSLALALIALLSATFFRRRRTALAFSGVALAMSLGALARQIQVDYEDLISQSRNFYGTLTISEHDVEERLGHKRVMWHGAVKHGEQYQAQELRRQPTTYYGRSAGIGLALANFPPGQRHVGLVGLGIGTLAAYGQAGDRLRFYEINPAVLRDAQAYFSYLKDTPASVEHVLGDARLSMEREPPQRFDVLAIDAFSGDAVPAHLLTREALAVYLRHLKPQGLLSFHVTNRFLNLPPVLAALAADMNLHAIWLRDENDDPLLRNTDWVVMARTAEALQDSELTKRGQVMKPDGRHSVWTDDYNNLFETLR